MSHGLNDVETAVRYSLGFAQEIGKTHIQGVSEVCSADHGPAKAVELDMTATDFQQMNCSTRVTVSSVFVGCPAQWKSKMLGKRLGFHVCGLNKIIPV